MQLSVEGLGTEDEWLVGVSVRALLLQRDTVTKETYVFNWGVLIVSEGLSVIIMVEHIGSIAVYMALER